MTASDTQPNSSAKTGLRKQWPIYAGCAAVLVLAIAYVDGGEEPIHPIVQQISTPESAGENS